MGDDPVESVSESVEVPETEMSVVRLISLDDPRLAPFLSYCTPGQPSPVLDPDSQSVIAAEDSAGNLIGAAIVSGVFHVAYLLPLRKEVNILTMQREAEALLPRNTLYYTMTYDGDEADTLCDELGMQQAHGVTVLMKKKE